MIAVKCPHCQAAIRCDDRFAGQVVLCPTCKKQLQMPTVAQPLPAQASAGLPDSAPTEEQNFTWTPGDTQRSSTRYSTSRTHTSRRKKTDPTLYIVGGVLVVVAVLGIALVGGGGLGSKGHSSQPAAYEQGHAMGKAIGEVHRNYGTNDIDKAKETLDSPEIKPGDIPKIGTPEYGDFIKGFEEGYFRAVSR